MQQETFTNESSVYVGRDLLLHYASADADASIDVSYYGFLTDHLWVTRVVLVNEKWLDPTTGGPTELNYYLGAYGDPVQYGTEINCYKGSFDPKSREVLDTLLLALSVLKIKEDFIGNSIYSQELIEMYEVCKMVVMVKNCDYESREYVGFVYTPTNPRIHMGFNTVCGFGQVIQNLMQFKVPLEELVVDLGEQGFYPQSGEVEKIKREQKPWILIRHAEGSCYGHLTNVKIAYHYTRDGAPTVIEKSCLHNESSRKYQMQHHWHNPRWQTFCEGNYHKYVPKFKHAYVVITIYGKCFAQDGTITIVELARYGTTRHRGYSPDEKLAASALLSLSGVEMQSGYVEKAMSFPSWASETQPGPVNEFYIDSDDEQEIKEDDPEVLKIQWRHEHEAKLAKLRKEMRKPVVKVQPVLQGKFKFADNRVKYKESVKNPETYFKFFKRIAYEAVAITLFWPYWVGAYLVTAWHRAMMYVLKTLGMQFMAIFLPLDFAYKAAQISKMTFTEIMDEFNDMDLENKMTMIEVKVALHGVYWLLKRKPARALEHTSYLFLTRPIDAVAVLTNVGVATWSCVDVLSHSTIEVEGKPYTVHASELDKLCRMSDRGVAINPDKIVTTMEVQAGELEVVTNNLSMWLANFKLAGMSTKDIELANKQYAFVRATQIDSNQKVQMAHVIARLACRTAYGFDPNDGLFMLFSNDILDLGKNIDAVAFQRGQMAGDKNLMEMCISLHKQSQKIGASVRLCSIPGWLVTYYRDKHRVITELTMYAHQLLRGAKQRSEPVSVLFIGSPGSGKSPCVNYLMKAICRIDGEIYSPEMMYLMNDSKYWAGYGNQKFVVGDDIFSITQAESLAAMAHKVIDMVNTNPMNLDMAGVEEKGVTFFDSPYCFFTSNYGVKNHFAGIEWSVKLKDPRALAKRFHLVLHRDDKSLDDVSENLYCVDKCDVFPEFEGRELLPVEIAELVHKMRVERDERMLAHTLSPDDIDKQLDAANVRRKHLPLKLVDEGFEVQNGPDDIVDTRKPPDAMEWILKIAPLQLTEWSKSPNFKYHLLGFGLLVLLITVPALMYKFMPADDDEIETHSLGSSGTTRAPTTNSGATKYSQRSLNFKKAVHDDQGAGYSGVPHHRFEKHVGFTDMEEIMQEFEKHGAEVDFYNNLQKTVSKGILYIELWFESEWMKRKMSIAFHVRDRLIILPAHSIVPYCIMSKFPRLMIHSNGTDYDIDEWPNVVRVANEDIAFFLLPLNVPMPKALFRYLPEAKAQVEMAPTQEIYQVGIDVDRTLVVRSLMRIPYSNAIKYEVANEVILMCQPIAYIGDCRKGHSGCPSFIDTPKGPILVGMHVGAAGKARDVGVSVPLCKEWISDFFQGLEVQTSAVGKIVEYTVAANLANNLPRYSRIKQSRICSWNGPPTCVPVRFMPFEKDGVLIDPLQLALAKIKQESFVYTIPYDDSRFLAWFKLQYPRDSKARVLTFDEALNGVPELGIPSIVASTSPGYPYSLHAKKGKAPFITRIDNRLVYQPEFLEQLRDMELQLRSGQQIEVIWSDTLKDETKDVAKVAEGKVRLFNSCPLHYLILQRKYGIMLSQFMATKCTTAPVAVGINPHGLDWTVLGQRINRFGKSVVAGDFERFDSTISEPLGRTELSFCNWWYNGSREDDLVRSLLQEHLWKSTHICGQDVWISKDANPTGQGNTARYNSVVSAAINHKVLTEDMGLLESEFEISVYGDDNIIGIDRDGVRCSDMAPHFMRRFGMSYTHYSKVKTNDPCDTIATVSYLGRSFVWRDSRIAAPRPLIDIIESTYWTRGKDPQYVAFCSTCLNYFLDLSHFDIETFDLYSQRLMDEIKEAGMTQAYEYLVRARKTYYEYHDLKYDPQHVKKLAFYMRGDTSKWTAFEQTEIKPGVFITEFETQSGSMENVVVSENREFTERAANKADVMQDTQLANYKDVAPTGLGAMDHQTLLGPQQSFNTEKFTLDDVIQREFQLTSFTWSDSDATNTTKATYSFPQVLFDQAFIAEKIKDFRFFRGSIRVSIRIVSNKMLYGSLMMYYWPVLSAFHLAPANLKNASACPHILASASAGDTMVFDIPFVYNKRVLDLTNYNTNGMGAVYIKVMNPLVDILGESSAAQVFVTAQFRDVELFYPHDASSSALTAQIAKRYIDSEFDVHSGSVHKAPAKKVAKSVALKGLEARNKIAAGTISSTKAVRSVMESGLESLSFVSSFVTGAAQAAGPLMAMAGLSKPKTTDATTIMKVNPFIDLNTGTGLDFTPTLGMDPENAISTMPNVAGCTTDEMDLRNFCGKPLRTRSITFTKGNATPQTLAVCNIQSRNFADDFCDYTDWLSNFFLYVSGSRKVRIYIYASTFHSARFVLYLSDSSTSAIWQNCYHMVVDVQGDTEIEFTLPYSSCNLATSTDGTGEINQFTLSAFPLSWSQPDDTVTAPIYFNVYTAGANDVEFGGLVENFMTTNVGFEPHSCPVADFAQDFEPFHPTMLSYSPVNVIYGEKYTTIRQMVHKYQALCALNVVNYAVRSYNGGGNVGLGYWTGLEMIGLIYHFWRGSTRFKIITPGLNPTALWVTRDTKVLSGCSVASTVNQVMEIEIPYYEQVFYQDTADYSLTQVNFTSDYDPTWPQSYIFSAAGDDFSFHFQCFPRSDAVFNSALGVTRGFSFLKVLSPYPPSS